MTYVYHCYAVTICCRQPNLLHLYRYHCAFLSQRFTQIAGCTLAPLFSTGPGC